jgi:hypothetical protein
MTTLASNALCTRLQLKTYLNVNQADATYDNLCHEIINRISQAFENYCGRQFKVQDIVEYHDGNVRALFPDQYPINSVTEIREDSDWVWGSETIIDSSDYRIMDSKYIIYDGFFTSGEGAIKLTYNAGYTDVPADLVQACIEECGRKMKHRNDYDESVKTLGDGSVSYIASEFLPQTKMTLNSYRYYAGI